MTPRHRKRDQHISNRLCAAQSQQKVSLLVTDEWVGYKGLDREFPHAVIRHTDHQYVIGAIHTNTIEGFWSIFKRGVVGTFHKVSAKYLPLYIAEFQIPLQQPREQQHLRRSYSELLNNSASRIS